MADKSHTNSTEVSPRNHVVSPGFVDPHLTVRSNMAGYATSSRTPHANKHIRIKLPQSSHSSVSRRLDRSLSARSSINRRNKHRLSARSSSKERLHVPHLTLNGGTEPPLSARSSKSELRGHTFVIHTHVNRTTEPPLSARSNVSQRSAYPFSGQPSATRESSTLPRANKNHKAATVQHQTQQPLPVSIQPKKHYEKRTAIRSNTFSHSRNGQTSTVQVKADTGDSSHKFDTLKDTCQQKGILYEDPEFPADDTALNMDLRNIGPVVWRRPVEMSSYPTFVANGTPNFEISQGPAGGSWLTASLTCLIMAPNLVKQCIPADQSFDEQYAGIFHFKFWRFGEWINVIIDDKLPTVNGEFIFLHSSDPNEFWPALLEKAYAKLYGSYGHIQGRYMKWGLQDITGGIVDTYHIYENINMIRNILDVCMTKATLLGALISTNMTSGQRKRLTNGLVSGYVYSITGYAEIPVKSGSLILVRLRNPFGNYEWNGAWSEGSQQWDSLTQELKDKLTQRKTENGEFWMSFVDFSNIFTMIEVCHLTPESWKYEPSLNHRSAWTAAAGFRKWRKGYNAGGPSTSPVVSYNCQFYLDLPSTCIVVVSVMQPYSHRKDDKGTSVLSCGSLIYHAPKDTQTRLGPTHFHRKNLFASKGFTKERENVGFFTLPAGCYVALPVTNHRGGEGKFLIRIFVSDKVKIRELDEDDRYVEVKHENFHDLGLSALRRKFLSISNQDEELDHVGLQRLLMSKRSSKIRVFCFSGTDEGFQVRRLQLPLEICKYAVAITDTNMDGKITFDEFNQLLTKIIYWQGIFQRLSNGHLTVDTYSLRNGLNLTGFSVSNKTLEALVIRFAAKETLTLEGFINILIKLSFAHRKFALTSKEQANSANKFSNEMLLAAIYS